MAAMKHGHALAIGTLALLLAACGGSHHGGSRNDVNDPIVVDPGPSTTAAYRIEAVLTNPAVDAGYLYQDPLDIQILDNVTFQLVSYSGTGSTLTRTVVPTSNSQGGLGGVSFTTSDSQGAFGSLSTGDGAFNASRRDSGTQRFIVTASYLGQTYQAFYRVNPRLNQSRVRGLVAVPTGTSMVIGSGSESPVYRGVYNATVLFYEQRDPLADEDSTAQVVVQQVRTGPDGTFRASVPVRPTNVGGVPLVRALVLPPDEFDPSFGFGGTVTQAFSAPSQSDLLSLPLLDSYPSTGTLNTPPGGGDVYLIPSEDIVRNDDGTFYLSNEDRLTVDTERLFVLSETGSPSPAARALKATKRK